MKKIIALALALIMALSMGVVAFAADWSANDAFDAVFSEAEDPAEEIVTNVDEGTAAPGEKFVLKTPFEKRDWKISYDFTSSKYDFDGASMIASIAAEKNAELTEANDGEPVYELVLTLKENLTSTAKKEIAGIVTLTSKEDKTVKDYIFVNADVNNTVEYVDGAKKAADADDISEDMAKNHVIYAEDGAGYVAFEEGSLTGTVKLAKDEKAQVYVLDQEGTEVADEDLVDAVEAYLGDDYDAIVEWYNFCGTGFGADVDFQYDAWEEDPHFFYAWDGEKFVDLEAKYDDDEDVDDYVFTAAAKGLIVVTDVEIVAAADTKNPDTGANDVVGVAAALAVVSLVAAGAVSLKK